MFSFSLKAKSPARPKDFPARMTSSGWGHSGRPKLKARQGFTLIEMLVVIGVTGLLSGMVILYGGSGRRLVSLSVEAAKIAQVIQRAKAASVLVEYRPAEPVCGYGVHLAYAERRYTFFRYLASTLEDCNTISNIDAGYDEINSFSLPKGIVFKDASDGISDILFIPPDPRTLLFRSTARVNGNYKILLASEDGTLEHAVGINSGGQVSF